jgi:hypothetical protein
MHGCDRSAPMSTRGSIWLLNLLDGANKRAMQQSWRCLTCLDRDDTRDFHTALLELAVGGPGRLDKTVKKDELVYICHMML